jgi:hypothetical protein
MSNRFRDPTMRQQYDGAMRAYKARHRDLFRDGRQFVGSSFANAFWDGFNGRRGPGRGWAADAASRACIAYAYWRAGQDAAKAAAA